MIEMKRPFRILRSDNLSALQKYFLNTSPLMMKLYSFAMIFLLWETVASIYGTSSMGAQILPGWKDTFFSFIAYANYWPGGLGAGDTRMGYPETFWGATLGVTYSLGATLTRLFLGLVIGFCFGVSLGFLVSWSSLMRDVLSFPLHFVRMMPFLALVPLFAMWFSDKNIGGVIFIAVAVFVIMFVATISGVRNASQHHVQWAKSLGSTEWFIYTRVTFPSILPELKGSTLLSLGFSWNAALASEFLGQRVGLGVIVMKAQEFGRMDLIMLTALLCIVMTSVTFFVTVRLFSWITSWAE